MGKLTSTKYTTASFNIAIFLLRVGSCALMIPHGYNKLVNFAKYKGDFMNFLGIGSTASLALAIFAEFFCALFLLVGLFSRVMTIPLIIAMFVALAKAHNWDVLGDGEHAALFILIFSTILLVGPGKASVDGMLGK
jgi:putative oxidoreductase